MTTATKETGYRAGKKLSFYGRVSLLAEATIKRSKSDEERLEALKVKELMREAANATK